MIKHIIHCQWLRDSGGFIARALADEGDVQLIGRGIKRGKRAEGVKFFCIGQMVNKKALKSNASWALSDFFRS